MVLVAKESIKVNQKMHKCFTCSKEGMQGLLYAVKKHFKIEAEGDPDGFFYQEEDHEEECAKELDNNAQFQEPKTKWKNSAAKKILYNLIIEGTVPDEVDSTMPLQDIYMLHPKFAKYDSVFPVKFSLSIALLRSETGTQKYGFLGQPKSHIFEPKIQLHSAA